MNRSWILAVTAGCVLTLAACSNDGSRNSNAQNSSNPNATANRESDNNNPTVTLTGCLTEGSSSGSYVLQNVRANKDKDAKDVQQATGTVPTSYVVIAASDKVDLQKQLNHEVEIKGKPDISMRGTSAGTGTSGTSATGSATGTSSATQNAPRLLANNIKSVADRCTAPSPQ